MCPAYAAMSSSRKGDYLEQYVITKLMAKGIEVFKNVSCVGKTDLVARRPGEEVYYPFDVKSKSLQIKMGAGGRSHWDGSYRWSMSGKGYRVASHSVYLILVTPDRKGYRIGWHKDPRRRTTCPPGWETLFDDE